MDETPLTLVRKAPGYLLKRARRWLVARRLERYFEANPDHHALDGAAALAALESAEQVLFLCWGNICRSPLAERGLRGALDGDVPAVRSAGLGAYAGRESPTAAVETAARYGVELADHRSRLTTDRLVRASDVVLLMDYNDFHALTERYPEAERRAFFLGALADDDRPPVIEDPHGAGRQQFERTYARILTAVERIAAAVDDEHEE